ncbi:MAG: NUDIX hydrolase [Candidatus Thalassarchaeaceae archaeon]|jgi:ADP-ribose pyrophosphatase YjhB (NUDIX family)|nr:NUDIX hydrolase [Candidatus Thalassarchaeaceae archaeon]
MGTHLYLEHDGKVLLVNMDGEGPQQAIMGRVGDISLRLPSVDEVAQMGISWTERRTNRFSLGDTNHEVIYALPEIEWPENWTWKDQLISDNCVNPIAREAVYRSMHRVVSKVILVNPDGHVAMAKVKRGFFTGHWTLPGGFVDYAEHPQEGAVREVLEELGVEVTLTENPLNISERIFTSEGIQFLSFTYCCQVPSDVTFNPKADEIEEARFFTLEEALSRAASLFDVEALRMLEESA